jgi:hypothetical protein
MKIIIEAVDGINFENQLRIVSDYLNKCSSTGISIITGKDSGLKIESGSRRFHVNCRQTKTTLKFKIWFGV